MGLRNVVTWMPESSCFRTALQSERVHVPQTPVKSTRQKFYPKFPLIQDKLSSKTSLLVRPEILGVFGKRLTTDHKYFRRNWEKFPQHVETPLSSKIENIFWNFHCIFGIYMKFCGFSKKTSASYLKYFGGYWVREMWLLKCLKAPILEHPSRVNAFTGPKHCWNLHGSTFIVHLH